MTLAEEMQIMFDELRAIKHMNKSIKAQECVPRRGQEGGYVDYYGR